MRSVWQPSSELHYQSVQSHKIAWPFSAVSEAFQRWQSIQIMQTLLAVHYRCFGIPQVREPKAKPPPSTEGEGFADELRTGRSAAKGVPDVAYHQIRPDRFNSLDPKLGRLESSRPHTSTPLRPRNPLPVGVSSPKAPDRHCPQVMAGPEGVHRSDRLRRAELQATGIHLVHHR